MLPPLSLPSATRAARGVALAAALLAVAACGDDGAAPDAGPIGVAYDLSAAFKAGFNPYPQPHPYPLPAVFWPGLMDRDVVLAGRLELDEPGLRYRVRVRHVEVRGGVGDTLTETDFGRLRRGVSEGGEQAYDLVSEDESDVVGLLVRSDSAGGVVRVHGLRRDDGMVYWFER